MKRIVLATLISAVSIAPFASSASGERDGKTCRESEATTAWADTALVTEPGNATNADRIAWCVRANGTTVFYGGGEANPEEPYSGAPGPCGAVIVNDATVTSSHGDNWDFDHVHPGPDGERGTDDDEIHHHDCN